MKKIKDGWHTISGYTVYVEDGKVLRGLSSDKQKAVFPYRAVKDGWTSASGLTVGAFRSGVRRETIIMA